MITDIAMLSADIAECHMMLCELKRVWNGWDIFPWNCSWKPPQPLFCDNEVGDGRVLLLDGGLFKPWKTSCSDISMADESQEGSQLCSIWNTGDHPDRLETWALSFRSEKERVTPRSVTTRRVTLFSLPGKVLARILLDRFHHENSAYFRLSSLLYCHHKSTV